MLETTQYVLHRLLFLLGVLAIVYLATKLTNLQQQVADIEKQQTMAESDIGALKSHILTNIVLRRMEKNAAQ